MELDKLDKVALLARSRETQAASALQQQQQSLDASQARLNQLESFKLEYEQRLNSMARTGMDARQLADYRQFLANLNDAIQLQGDEVQRDREEVQNRREVFVDQSLRRGNVDELIGRGRAAQAVEEARREQRLSDETSMARHRGDG